MREFKTSCIDDRTGYEMILSECSYNMACDWLNKELAKVGSEICGMHYDRENQIIELYTGLMSNGLNLKRKFFYDESRGYLLGE